MADSISVTTSETRDRYAALFPESAGKIAMIPPLVDFPEIGGPAAPPRADRRRLVFLGRLYPSIRRPDYLLSLFASLAEEPGGERYELHFFGDSWQCEADFAPHKRMLGRNLFVHGPVPRERAIAEMRSADVLVNIGNDTRAPPLENVVEREQAAAR